MKRITTYIYALACFLLLWGAYSCAEGTDADQQSDGENRLVFAVTRSNQDIVNHTTVYQFDTSWQFMKKIQGVTYGTDELSMRMDAGIWNLALVTGEDLNPAAVISPVSGEGRGGKMWQTQAVGGVLSSMPELRTAYIESQLINPNTINYASTTMYRNVAKVRLYIEKTRGLDPSGIHTLYINNVPTTLNWAGELYPDKYTPDVSASPLKGTFSIHDKVGDAGFQESDVLEFIIPAHKGNDYLSPSPQDTTTHKLNLSVDLACMGGTRFVKNNVEISQVPRANSILEVRLSMVGEMEVFAHVLNWNEIAVSAVLEHTDLMVSKAKVELAYKDTIYVNTNAADFTVTPESGVSWMNAVRIGTTNAVEITAEVTSYNNPRSSYFSVTANNLLKRIPVMQRPEKGTISVDNKRLVFCPVTHTQRTIQISSIKGGWEILAPSTKAASNVQTGNTGNTNVTFTRASTTDFNLFDTCYGDDYVIVKNTTTLDTDTIWLVNCYIDVSYNTINANAPTGTNQTAETVSEGITVYGGNKGLFIDQWSTWIHSSPVWNASEQKLTFTTDREPDDEPRDGFMTFHHAECSDYAMTVTVHQDIIVTIPPFDFFVVQFKWASGDVDIAVTFAGNHVSGNETDNNTYDKIPVGWGTYVIIPPGRTLVNEVDHSQYRLDELLQNPTTTNANGRTWFKYKSQRLLFWGGDATGGQGESVFFNAPVFEGDVDSPRNIKMEIYAHWYTSSAQTAPMTFTWTAYKGGVMYQGTSSQANIENMFNFYNRNGSNLGSQSYSVIINSYGQSSSFVRAYDQPFYVEGNSPMGGYTHVATLTYDRIKHTASVRLHAASVSAPVLQLISTPIDPVAEKAYNIEKNKIVR